MGTEFHVLPRSAVDTQADLIADALAAGRPVYLAEHGQVVEQLLPDGSTLPATTPELTGILSRGDAVARNEDVNQWLEATPGASPEQLGEFFRSWRAS